MSRTTVDQTAITAAGYPTVRAALNQALNACVGKLTQADLAMAEEILAADGSELLETGDSRVGIEGLLMDTALFSRPGGPLARSGRRRAIDRLAPKISAKRDPLLAAVAGRLPHAFFSVFQVEGRDAETGVLVKDLLDGGRSLRVMDNALAASAQPGTLFAARFVDLGPWLAGFGIIITLRKSEAAAILIALADDGGLGEKRDALHELVYTGCIHGADLVLVALEPLISALAFAIDETNIEVTEIVASFRSATGLLR